jgi:ubiquitin-conjugating enzyme E2 J1
MADKQEVIPERIRINASINQFKRAIRSPEENIKYAMHKDNPLVWYAMLHGIADDFEGGEYIVRIETTPKFPYAPPWFYLMTPNGVYDIEKKVCIDIGGYHSQNYRAVLGIDGFAKQLVSGLIGGIDHGLSILHTTSKQKQSLAKLSVEYNLQNHKEIVEHINNTYAEYSTKWSTSTATSTAPCAQTDVKNNGKEKENS